MLQVDRDLISSLEPGKGYSILQTIDDFNTTHWVGAAPYNGRNRMHPDAIMEYCAKDKAKRVVKDDLLNWE